MLLKKTKLEIEKHAREEYPRECCGLLISVKGKEKYKPCVNIAAGKDDFKIDPQDWTDVEDEGEILAVVHSHPDVSAEPSEADRVSCEATGIVWIIVALNKDSIKEFNLLTPTGYKAPLLGRPFYHGVLDCYTLIRDFYDREFDIKLPNFERENDWWYKGKDLYSDNFVKAGFVALPAYSELKFGDVFLMRVRSDVFNHAGVFISGGKLKEIPDRVFGKYDMLHHLYGRLSSVDHYKTYFVDNASLALRHVNLMG